MNADGRDVALDRFQREAIAEIDRGHSVLVAAPTGAGKTLIAEHAVERSLHASGKAFYTTPIKALSNQKYRDLLARHGAGRVGLLTGDNSVNPGAPIVVMTTEVLRNMVYAGSPLLTGLAWVILDEVHYLRDRYRGPVWEEVLIHTPASVRMVCLSATVSNVDELAGWIRQVRGPTAVVVESERPIRLEHRYVVRDRIERRNVVIPTLVDGRANPDGSRFDLRKGRGSARRRWATPRRGEVIEHLARDGRLPAIYFIFSRIGCDEAAHAVVAAGADLTTPDERRMIRQIVEERTRVLDAADLAVLGFDRWMDGLLRGIGAHHAGLVPPFKEAVEACFVRGLIKVVFATETLALGINMPARTVVIERLSKFGGETHDLLTPLEYTQLTGRAGRRGIDTEGQAMVLWSPFVTFGEVAGLAASRSFTLRSAFRPSYNMVANLAATADEATAREVLRRSFAQYQIDRDGSELEHRLRRKQAELTELEEDLHCERGDVVGYVAQLDAAERARADASAAVSAAVEEAMSSLRPGDVIRVDVGAEVEPAVVLSVAYRKGGAITVRAVTPDRLRLRLRAGDFASPPRAVGVVDLPHPYMPGQAVYQREVARRLRQVRLAPERSNGERADTADELHPVAGCPQVDRHVAAARDRARIIRSISRIEDRLGRAHGALSRQFDAVVAVLRQRRALDGWKPTRKGELVASIYNESDLLVAEAIDAGLFDGLDPASLAALVSGLVYEPRGPDEVTRADLPTAQLQDRFGQLELLALDLGRLEAEAGIELTRQPDRGFAASAFDWADGQPLQGALADEMTGGDFVRNIRLLIDLCRQVADLVDLRAATAARRAVGLLERGVVSASGSIAQE